LRRHQVSQEPAGSTHPSEDDDDLFELPFSVSSRMNESRHYSASVMGENARRERFPLKRPADVSVRRILAKHLEKQNDMDVIR